jgi:hypothetical protein
MSLFLIFAVASLTAQAVRLGTQSDAGAMQTGGKHKCTIKWPGRGNGESASVSFGVSSCIIKCKITNPEARPTAMFPPGFRAVAGQKTCSCQTLEGLELFKFPGACGAENEAKAKCFGIYTTMMTDEYQSQFNRETLMVVHNSPLYKDSTYDYTTCENDGCAGGDCSEFKLPSLWDTRDAKEKKLLAELIKKAATEGGRDLTVQQKDLLRTLAKGDIENAAEVAKQDADEDVVNQIQALFLRVEKNEDVIETPKEVAEEDPTTKLFEELSVRFGEEDGGLTVAKLKEHYKWLLRDTGISVDHLAIVADLIDDDHVVTQEEFKAFLKPAC